MVGLYLHPSRNYREALEGLRPKLRDRIHQFNLFSVVHTRAPYVGLFRTAPHTDINEAPEGIGWPNYFGDLGKHYPAKYSGPFTIGVCWQNASDADSSLMAQAQE